MKNIKCNDTRVPEHLQKHFRIQTRAPGGMWINLYGDLTATESSIYWKGQCAHNGHQARLLKRNKEIARKGDNP